MVKSQAISGPPPLVDPASLHIRATSSMPSGVPLAKHATIPAHLQAPNQPLCQARYGLETLDQSGSLPTASRCLDLPGRRNGNIDMQLWLRLEPHRARSGKRACPFPRRSANARTAPARGDASASAGPSRTSVRAGKSTRSRRRSRAPRGAEQEGRHRSDRARRRSSPDLQNRRREANSTVPSYAVMSDRSGQTCFLTESTRPGQAWRCRYHATSSPPPMTISIGPVCDRHRPSERAPHGQCPRAAEAVARETTSQ